MESMENNTEKHKITCAECKETCGVYFKMKNFRIMTVKKGDNLLALSQLFNIDGITSRLNIIKWKQQRHKNSRTVRLI